MDGIFRKANTKLAIRSAMSYSYAQILSSPHLEFFVARHFQTVNKGALKPLHGMSMGLLSSPGPQASPHFF
jgi:hypothetical protein